MEAPERSLLTIRRVRMWSDAMIERQYSTRSMVRVFSPMSISEIFFPYTLSQSALKTEVPVGACCPAWMMSLKSSCNRLSTVNHTEDTKKVV